MNESDNKVPNVFATCGPCLWEVVLYNPDTEMENNIPFILQDVFKFESMKSYFVWLSSALSGEEESILLSSRELVEALTDRANKALDNSICYSRNADIKFQAKPA